MKTLFFLFSLLFFVHACRASEALSYVIGDYFNNLKVNEKEIGVWFKKGGERFKITLNGTSGGFSKSRDKLVVNKKIKLAFTGKARSLEIINDERQFDSKTEKLLAPFKPFYDSVVLIRERIDKRTAGKKSSNREFLIFIMKSSRKNGQIKKLLKRYYFSHVEDVSFLFGNTPGTWLVAAELQDESYMFLKYAVSKEKITELHKAAQKGDAGAQFQLALCCLAGMNVPQHDLLALTWFMEAARRGHRDAQYFLGECFARGWGIKKNPGLALKWFKKAAAQGDVRAKKRVDTYYRNQTALSKAKARGDAVFRQCWPSSSGKYICRALAGQKAVISEVYAFPPVNSGFIILDSQYVDAPYYFEIVTVEAPAAGKYDALLIYLNGKIFGGQIAMKQNPQLGKLDPKIPPSINRNTSYHDKVYHSYIFWKRAYLKQRYKGRQLQDMIGKTYRDLPCVKKVTLDYSRDSMQVVLYNGEKYKTGMNLYCYAPFAQERLFSYLKKRTNHLTAVLERNEGIINNDYQTIPGEKAMAVLKMLSSNFPAAEKLKFLQQFYPYDISKSKSILELVDKFRGSTQLNQRLKTSH